MYILTNPFGKITINYYRNENSGHVYYEPLNKSKKIKDRFKILKKYLDSVRLCYQIREEHDWIVAMTSAACDEDYEDYEDYEDDEFLKSFFF